MNVVFFSQHVDQWSPHTNNKKCMNVKNKQCCAHIIRETKWANSQKVHMDSYQVQQPYILLNFKTHDLMKKNKSNSQTMHKQTKINTETHKGYIQNEMQCMTLVQDWEPLLIQVGQTLWGVLQGVELGLGSPCKLFGLERYVPMEERTSTTCFKRPSLFDELELACDASFFFKA